MFKITGPVSVLFVIHLICNSCVHLIMTCDCQNLLICLHSFVGLRHQEGSTQILIWNSTLGVPCPPDL